MNRHERFKLICNSIDYELKNFIIYEENWNFFYWKIDWKEILKKRSVNEIVYKPFFMKKLRDKLSLMYSRDELQDIYYEMLFIKCMDIVNYLFIKLELWN
jgi:hypothetical protein